MRYLLLSSALLLSSFSAFAQLVEAPLNYNKTLHRAAQEVANAPVQARPVALTLPFIDDFSYNSVYPSGELWENKQAWVNRGMGIKPPTVGVATLDGLQPNGLPYSWLGLANAGMDTMRSRPINLGSFLASDSIYLSFYYQPGGNGDMPEATDKLLIDFKNNAGVWVNQRTIAGQTGTPPAFRQVRIVINTATFLHPDFQFRFRTLGKTIGARDHWHIDYVKIAKNNRWNETSFNDVAFYDTPLSPFLNYTAMPYSHFKTLNPTTIMSPSVIFRIWNHFNTPYSPNLSIAIDEQYSNTVILPQQTPFFQPIPQNRDSAISSTIAVANYNFSGLPQNTDSALLRVRYLFTNITGQDNLQNQTNFPLQNDTVTRIVPLRDYFAYDDGSAESAIITQNVGTRAAIKFRTLVKDSLQGVQLHVPAFDANVQTQLFDFEVYVGSLSGTPVFTQTNLHPYYGDSLQYWTSYSFSNGGAQRPPEIPANTDFYIVWRQASAGTAVPIGLDKNTPANAQFLYQNTGTGWNPMGTNVRGALMMRPYLGNKRFIDTEEKAVKTGVIFTIQPNPCSDILSINSTTADFDTYNYNIINALGQNIQNGNLSNSLSVSHLPQGIYFLQFVNKNGTNSTETKTIRFVKL
jgi:Secretion system C-terminal sorting domain